MLDEKNLSLLEDFGVMSRVETISHYEIKLEQYANLINIETLTMLDMANSLILPAVNAYAADVAANLAVKKDLDAPCRAETKLLGRGLRGRQQIARTGIDELKDLHDAMVATEDLQERANKCRDEVLPAMDRLRGRVDAMETICSKEYWPRPPTTTSSSYPGTALSPWRLTYTKYASPPRVLRGPVHV